MTTPYSGPTWASGNPAVATAVSLPVFSSPIPGVKTEYMLTQKFQQFLNNWTALALGTPHDNYPTFYLVEEGPREDTGIGGIVEWVRTYCAIPEPHDEFESFVAIFPGLLYVTTPVTTATVGRNPQQWTVQSRIEHEYFLCASGQTYGSPSLIPIKEKELFIRQFDVSGTTYGGKWAEISILDGYTMPTISGYRSMMKEALASGWQSTESSQTWNNTGDMPVLSGSTDGGQFIAENSRLDRWRGNIFVRRTRWVLAQ